MKLPTIGLITCLLLTSSCAGKSAQESSPETGPGATQTHAADFSCAAGQTDYVLLAHGGSLSRRPHPNANRRREALKTILQEGQAAIAKGASALDSATLVVALMEDSGLFNAGRGAIRNQAGERELDASIMDGPSQKAGAVASIKGIRNPVHAARFVMEQTENVLFVGPSAERLLRDAGLEQASLDEDDSGHETPDLANRVADGTAGFFGTVGAVALDRCGHLAAATSTGGFGSKVPGRVGDSPIIGAGTYANETVAVSATGHGEFFIRYAVAHDIYARIRYGGQKLPSAAADALSQLESKGGKGGVIALGHDGSYALPFTAAGMTRGVVGAGIELDVRSY